MARIGVVATGTAAARFTAAAPRSALFKTSVEMAEDEKNGGGHDQQYENGLHGFVPLSSIRTGIPPGRPSRRDRRPGSY